MLGTVSKMIYTQTISRKLYHFLLFFCDKSSGLIYSRRKTRNVLYRCQNRRNSAYSFVPSFLILALFLQLVTFFSFKSTGTTCFYRALSFLFLLYVSLQKLFVLQFCCLIFYLRVFTESKVDVNTIK